MWRPQANGYVGGINGMIPIRGPGPRDYQRVMDRRQTRVKQLIYFTFVVQCIVLYGGIDLNFKTPLQTDLPQFEATSRPPAKRLVLIVADGLRAERLFDYDAQKLTPYLTDLKYSRGAWGIAVASVPTESRPGHVAILAGIYEDPSAIFKGWQDNPVNFDSVINQSANAFGWGSPDVLNIFNKENHPHIHFFTYPREMQDFNNPSIELDRWVMQRVEAMFESVVDKKNCSDFCSDKNIFFLHLLGMDNAGHVYKPHSQKYGANLRYVDNAVKKIEELFENFFGDKKTAYLFTADHGMTDWGSHGSGSSHETIVPVIAWGAGLATGKKSSTKQTDLAPLIASLLGIKIPSNSLGRLPGEYLDVDEGILAEMYLANTKQFAALYKRLEDSRKKFIDFKPFEALSEDGLLDEELNRIKDLIEDELFSTAVAAARKLMIVLEEGRKYYFDYFKAILTYCLLFSLHMWSAYLALQSGISYEDDLIMRRTRSIPTIVVCEIVPVILLTCMIPVAATVVYVSELPWPTYLYVSLPFVCAALIFMDYRQFYYAVTNTLQKDRYAIGITFCVYGFGLLCLFMAFFDRIYLIPVLLGIGLWGWQQQPILSAMDRTLWIILCFCASMFTVLPPVSKSNLLLHGIGVAAWLAVTTVVLKLVHESQLFHRLLRPRNVRIPPFLGQVAVCAVSLVLGYGTRSLNVVPLGINLLSWYLLGVITLLPFFTPAVLVYRLLTWLFALMSYYALVAVEYELLFMMAYVGLLCQWIQMEDKLLHFGYSSLLIQLVHRQQRFMPHLSSGHDVRRAFFFLAFALLGFFGTGNLASISSFDPMWVKPLITSFSPFIITGLIVIKISIPFLMCTIAVYTIHNLTPGLISTVFTIMLGYCEVMLTCFFVSIQTEGSWLDIGTSLSRFIVCGVIILILMIYYQIAEVFLNRGFVHLRQAGIAG